jgi:hypothetical protein
MNTVSRLVLLTLLLTGCDTDKLFPHVTGQIGPIRTENWTFVTSSSSKHGYAISQPPTGPTVYVPKRRCHAKVPIGTVIPVKVTTLMYSDGLTRIDYGDPYTLAMQVCR